MSDTQGAQAASSQGTPDPKPATSPDPARPGLDTASKPAITLRDLVIRLGDLSHDLGDKELRDRINRLVSAVDLPGRSDDPRYRTQVAYAVQDLERLGMSTKMPGTLRAELGQLASTYPGLQNERMAQMVAGTSDIASSALVRAIRATAAEIAGQPDQNTLAIASKVDALANRVRLGIEPAPAEPAAPRSEPARAAAEQPAIVQARAGQHGPAVVEAPARPGRTMLDVMAALRRHEPDPPAPWDRQLTPMGDRITAFNGRMLAGAEEAEMRRAERSGAAALAAVREFSDGPGSVLMGRIRDAAKADPQGMAGVLAEMRDGGRYAGLRQDLTVALQQQGFAAAYDRAAGAVTAYGADRAEVDKFAAQRPDAAVIAGRFQALDVQVGKAASEIPGRTEGKSLTDDMAERAREIITKAVEVVSNAFNRLRPSAGPSPAP